MQGSSLDRTVQRLSESILAKQKRANELALELVASLGIQDVWPEAFEGGQSCKLCAREAVRTMQEYEYRRARRAKSGREYTPELKEMYLLRDDGVRFQLTAPQYWALRSTPRSKS